MVAYKTFDNYTVELTPTAGRNVALLTPTGYDPQTLAGMVDAVDDAWNYYADITGREPAPVEQYTYQGRGTIAVVPTLSYGAAAGFLGTTGIEITQSPYFDYWYNSYRDYGTHDQAVFYELGRNFWFYGDQLGAIDAFVTGFAIVNRALSMDHAGLEGAPFNGTIPLDQITEAILQDMAQLYLAGDATAEAALTTQPPANDYGLGAADLAASLFYRIHEDFGPEAYAQFWRSLGTLPKAATAAEAQANFLTAAGDATGISYAALFKDGWALEVGDGRGNTIAIEPHGTNQAAFGFGGNDRITGSNEQDYVFAGAGNDTVRASDGDDDVVGATGRDWLDGGAGLDHIYGGPGNDILYGRAGDDHIEGGPGRDTSWGGQGLDSFVFNERPSSANADTIKDFKPADDEIELSGAAFQGLGDSGNRLAPEAFWTGSKAHDGSDRIIYNPQSGALFYDPDGTGETGQVRFATLSRNLVVTADDILVI